MRTRYRTASLVAVSGGAAITSGHAISAVAVALSLAIVAGVMAVATPAQAAAGYTTTGKISCMNPAGHPRIRVKAANSGSCSLHVSSGLLGWQLTTHSNRLPVNTGTCGRNDIPEWVWSAHCRWTRSEVFNLTRDTRYGRCR